MAEFHIVDYSISNLKALFQKYSKTPAQNLSTKIHLTYFEEYFKVLDSKTILVEVPYVDHDYLEDFSAYYVKCFKDYDRFCTRLHFFSIPFSDEDFTKLLTSQNPHINNESLNKTYLGFIVVKPIPLTFIGRTCLKTYPLSDGRDYPFRHEYRVNLFGVNLFVKSLAYQEQDSIVAACASTAIWTAFQATAYLFQHSVPTPVEITKAAVKYFPLSNRHFPNKGLSEEQMAQAIRDVGLEPYLISASEAHIVKASVYAYQKAGIPLVLGFELVEEGAEHPLPIGRHAVTISGYRLDGEKVSFPGSRFHLLSSRINKIYAHDDQVGPFARMEFLSDGNKLSTSWPDSHGELGRITSNPTILLVPLYNKLRIPFESILKVIFKLDELFDIIDDHLHLGIAEIEWEIFLASSNHLKEEILNSGLSGEEKLKILTKSLPKYVWRAIAHLNGERIELLFDTTDIEQGEIFLGWIKYSENLFKTIKTIADNIELRAIKLMQLHSIFESLRD